MKKQKTLREMASSGRPDYKEYLLSKTELAIGIILGVGALIILDYLFYRTTIALIVLSPIVPLVILIMKRKQKEKRKKRLRMQFRDMMQSLSAAICAGYSVENAILEAKSDMTAMYGEKGMITCELGVIYEGIRNSRTPEEMFRDFALRSGLEEIEDFAEVFGIAKRIGGDLTNVIRVSTETISGKVETESEIETAIASKKMEGRIMDLVPGLMILYIDFTSPGFFSVLYDTIVGRIIMTVCLIGYVGAIVLSEKLMKIEV